MSFVFILAAALIGAARAETFETVQTPSGKIKGVNVEGKFGNVVQFRHIPYAKAPTGDLRFKKPVALEPWEDTFNADTFGPSCMQNLDVMPALKDMLENKEFSEDCLALNVYVPNKVSINQKKSVMIWIHGGGFVMGQGHAYNSSLMSLVGDVIVVTINYRVGVFGFLSTGDSASPGNYGLWDQIMAFKWVKNNIASFGGDPDLVTIFGESAGAFSVMLQMMVPENKGLFHKVIAQSGAAMTFFPFPPAPLNYAKKFAQRLNCTEEDTVAIDTASLMECIKKYNSSELQGAQDYVSSLAMDPNKLSFMLELFPCKDGELFKGNNPVENLFRDSDMRRFYRSLDFIAGTTDAEGLLMHMVASMYQEQYEFNVTDGIPSAVLCDKLAPLAADEFFHDINGVVAKAICEFYRSDDIKEQGRKILDFFGDFFFVAATVDALNIHTADNEMASYQYLFSEPSVSKLLGDPPKWSNGGSTHGSELEFLFTVTGFLDFFEKKEDKENAELFIRMLKYWTNFAKTGNPNGEGLPVWPRYEPQDKAYIDLNLEISQKRNLFADRVNFFLEQIPQLLKNEKMRDNRSEL